MKKFSIYFVLFIIMVTINPCENSWAIDIKKMAEPKKIATIEGFEEYVDGINGIKWGALEVVGTSENGSKTIAGITYESSSTRWGWYLQMASWVKKVGAKTKDGKPYKKKYADSYPLLDSYYTKDYALYFFDSKMFRYSLFLNKNDVEGELQKITKLFGVGKPSENPKIIKVWDLENVTINLWKHNDGEFSIDCFHKKGLAEFDKHRPGKDSYFQITKNTIYASDVDLPGILSTTGPNRFYLSSDVCLDSYPNGIKGVIRYVLRDYGIDKLDDCKMSPGSGEESSSHKLWCSSVIAINCLNYYYSNLYDDKRDATFILKDLTKSIENIKKYGEDGEKAINFIDEYSNFVEKTYKEKIAQEQERKANKKSQQDMHAELIKSGKSPIKSLKDAQIFHNAKDDISIVTRPPFKSDNKYYVIEGVIDGKEDDFYRVKYLHGWEEEIHYFMFKVSKNNTATNFRIGDKLKIVGKLINVVTYATVAGTERYMSIFEAVYVE